MKVCQVANEVDTTSIPADIAVSLAKYENVESGILAWYSLSEFEGSEHVRTHCVDAPSSGFLRADIDNLSKATKTLSEYDIVQVHHNLSGSILKLLLYNKDVIVISTEQNDHMGFTAPMRFINGATNPFADLVTSISGAVRDSFATWENLLLTNTDEETIYNGVNMDRISASLNNSSVSYRSEYDIPDDDIVLSNAARLVEQKAQDTLIDAVNKANSRCSSRIHLIIAGDGKNLHKLKKQVEELGLEDEIHFAGVLDRIEVYNLMDQSDIFVMPSRWEGFCVAVAEAMAVGTPCVLSDIPVFKELYREPAIFHEVDDTPDLADAIVMLSEDDELREELSKKSNRLISENYSLRTIAGDYTTVFRNILNN